MSAVVSAAAGARVQRGRKGWMAVLKEKGKATKFWFVALGRKVGRGAAACVHKAR